MQIGIVGNGFVGDAIYQGMKNHFDILVYDVDSTRSLNTLEEVDKSDIVFVGVPTPMTEEGTFDVSILNSAISNLTPGKIIIVKSTVTPDFAQQLVDKFPKHSLIFNPEFLTERTAVWDFQNPSRIVIGGTNEESIKEVEKMYRIVFPSRLIPIIKTDIKTACFIKYLSNCFFAAKISLMNEFKQISDATGIDWAVAMNGLISSGHVNPMHTKVPGPDGDIGFGGKCFPKDINAFISYSNKMNIDPKMLKAAWDKNLEVRKDLNWLSIEGAVSKKGEKK